MGVPSLPLGGGTGLQSRLLKTFAMVQVVRFMNFYGLCARKKIEIEKSLQSRLCWKTRDAHVLRNAGFVVVSFSFFEMEEQSLLSYPTTSTSSGKASGCVYNIIKIAKDFEKSVERRECNFD